MERPILKKTWKQKLRHEFIEYWINAIYMAVFFSVFIFYRRMILAHYEIYLEDYFLGVIKALVFAKVIMIGAFLRIDRRFDQKPLIIPVFYKAFLFTVFVAVFDIAEKFISGFIHTFNLTGAIEELSKDLTNIWIGGVVVVFFCFIPFFAFKEVSRVMGPEKIQHLFFRKRT
jgi:hypothetical protein